MVYEMGTFMNDFAGHLFIFNTTVNIWEAPGKSLSHDLVTANLCVLRGESGTTSLKQQVIQIKCKRELTLATATANKTRIKYGI